MLRLIFFFALLVAVTHADFDYSEWVQNMTIVGNSQGDVAGSGAAIRITASTIHNVANGVWAPELQTVKYGFNCTFKILANGGANPAGGLAFVLGSRIAIGSPSWLIGYDMANTIAVEFDTHQENNGDPVNQHIAIQSCGQGTNTAHHGFCNYGLAQITPTSGGGSFGISDNTNHDVQITYSNNIMKVYWDGVLKVTSPSIDLGSLLNLVDGTRMYVGWVGSTDSNSVGAEDGYLIYPRFEEYIGIDSLSVNDSVVGQLVYVYGGYYKPTAQCFINKVAVPTTYVSGTTLKVVIPQNIVIGSALPVVCTNSATWKNYPSKTINIGCITDTYANANGVCVACPVGSDMNGAPSTSRSSCRCWPGYDGDATTGSCTVASTCSGHGTCATNGSCSCTGGYTSANCSVAPPTPAPSPAPTDAPTPAPTDAPTPAPTAAPTPAPTAAPTPAPTLAPTAAPTRAPTAEPTGAPTEEPTILPTVAPTPAPTAAPSTPAPTAAPTKVPTVAPTQPPTGAPTKAPTAAPTKVPTASPTKVPTALPTNASTIAPTAEPTNQPSLTISSATKFTEISLCSLVVLIVVLAC